jgi:uncharacterized membrane protein YcaP (DUF421 family)
MNSFYSIINHVLGIGLDQNSLNLSHMILRAIIVYIIAVVLIRIGKRRFLSTPTPVDVVLLLMFGSVMSRAITGNAVFFPTLATGCVLILLHTFFSYITFYSRSLGSLIKGMPVPLIKDGAIQWKNMRKHFISEKDLLSALRRNAKLTHVSQVHLALLERNGEISIIPHPRQPRIIELPVKQGVQTVKIELDAD